MRTLLLLVGLTLSAGVEAQSMRTLAYVRDIHTKGEDPFTFVRHQLAIHDLLIFDDALHSAYEPFEFYSHLVEHPDIGQHINVIFLEVISTNAQPLLDSFLNSKTGDSTILYSVFQDDYSGLGWRYQTYLDLLNTIRRHNINLPDTKRIKVYGVNPPIYWEAIHSPGDYDQFQNTLKSRDYFMYMEILEKMLDFRHQLKGIYLCNTRHAYTHMRNQEGQLYRNTTTFFSMYNPGKAFSIRIHNVSLFISKRRQPDVSAQKTIAGMEEMEYRWVRMDKGRWDSAFGMNGNRPVAIPLANTSFGKTPYIGNHMLNVRKGTTMVDAYDAVVFLAPLNQLHNSANMSFFYTEVFKPELERRLKITQGNHFIGFLKENGANSFDEFYQNALKYEPVTKSTLPAE